MTNPRTPTTRLMPRWLILATLLCAQQASAEVILHAFNWRYADVGAQAREIRERGYDSVLVSPPLKSEGAPWFARYQPQDYRIIDHALGNTEDFRVMSAALEDAGLRLYADVVLNHMANESSQRLDLNFPGQRVLDAYAANPEYYERQRLFGDLTENLMSAADFHEERCITDYNIVAQVQAWRLCNGGPDTGLPDLDDNARVIAAQRSYLLALKGIGVDGFRLDAAKHMTPKHMARVFDREVMADTFVFGEIITASGRGHVEFHGFLEPYIAQTTHSAYDFPLHSSIRSAFAFGGNLGLLADPLERGQALPGKRAITFTVNHDIPNNGIFRNWLLDPVDETLAYAYIIGRGEGSPLVYSDHNESNDGRWVDAWKRADLAAMNRFNDATEGETMTVLAAAPCHLLISRGNRGLVGINKCGQPVDLALPTTADKLWHGGSYRDALGTNEFTVNEQTRVTLPARTARMWLRE